MIKRKGRRRVGVGERTGGVVVGVSDERGRRVVGLNPNVPLSTGRHP